MLKILCDTLIRERSGMFVRRNSFHETERLLEPLSVLDSGEISLARIKQHIEILSRKVSVGIISNRRHFEQLF
jgi:hypothetical protein